MEELGKVLPFQQHVRDSTLVFEVEGDPVPKGRPRVVRKNGKVHTFTPHRTRAWQDLIGWKAREAMGRRKKYRRVRAVMVFHCGKRGDLDNYIKAALDACNGICFEDDSQVQEIHAARYNTEPKGLVISFTEIAPCDPQF